MKDDIALNEIYKATNNIETAKQISEIILISKNPELNYYAVLYLIINKKDHLATIINSKDPFYNYKCIKHCMKTTTLTIEEKKYFIEKHIEIIINSNNEKIIKTLKRFLKYNSIENIKNPHKRKKTN